MEIWIPESAKQDAPPKYFCRVCGEKFWSETKYQRHVVGCSNYNEAEIRAQSMRERAPALYGPEAGDPELESWVRRYRKPILEGKMKM